MMCRSCPGPTRCVSRQPGGGDPRCLRSGARGNLWGNPLSELSRKTERPNLTNLGRFDTSRTPPNLTLRTRNEGVPVSSPGVGSGEGAANEHLSVAWSGERRQRCGSGQRRGQQRLAFEGASTALWRGRRWLASDQPVPTRPPFRQGRALSTCAPTPDCRARERCATALRGNSRWRVDR